VDLCFLPRGDRLQSAESSAVAAAPEQLRALACLAVNGAPERVPELVARFPQGAERDQLVLDLLRFTTGGALAPRVAAGLAALVNPVSRPWTRAWLWATRSVVPGRLDWPGALLGLAAQAALDLDDPTTTRLRRRVWQAPRGETLPELARAALAALGAGGKPACEHGLRLFLNVYLAPRMGEEGGEEVRLRVAGVEAAEERARRLGPPHPLSRAGAVTEAAGTSAGTPAVQEPGETSGIRP